jgi:hypothetical protein
MSTYASSAGPTSLAAMVSGRSMPWVRCGTSGGADDPSTTWRIPDGAGGTRAPIYRELIILNHRNEVALTFKLGTQPIDGAVHAEHRAEVREALRTAAALPDTDADGLPDDWEMDAFGSLTAVSADSPTPSGSTALLAYATGQSPHRPNASMGLHLIRDDDALVLSYTRRLARNPALAWSVERSLAFTQWIAWPDIPAGTAVPRYDGTGTERVTHRLPANGPSTESYRLQLTSTPDPAG